MSVVAGRLNTANLTTGVMLDFAPFIQLLDPTDVALSGMFATESTFEKKFSWQDDKLIAPYVVTAATATTGELVLTVAAGTQARLQTDDVLYNRVNGEYLRVSAYGTTADTATIARAWGGSAATLGTGVTLEIVANAVTEGQDPHAGRSLDRVERYNYTEIWQQKVEVSESEMAVRKYGISGNEMTYQIAKKLKEVMILREKSLQYGVRVDDTTAAAPRRSSGGLIYYITTNVNSNAVALTETLLLDQIQNCYSAGGNPTVVLTGAKQKRVISGFTSAGVIQVAREDGTRGVTISTFVNDFGTVEVKLSRFTNAADLFIFEASQGTRRTLRPIQWVPLAKTGDSEKGMIVGEEGLMWERELHSARFSALT